MNSMTHLIYIIRATIKHVLQRYEDGTPPAPYIAQVDIFGNVVKRARPDAEQSSITNEYIKFQSGIAKYAHLEDDPLTFWKVNSITWHVAHLLNSF